MVDVRPKKEEFYQVRLAVGGNLIQYPGDVSTRSVDLTTSKYTWNSIISTVGAKYRLWEHISNAIKFTLVVDDFGFQYVGDQHDNHLINAQ
jgi:hypothetical protein